MALRIRLAVAHVLLGGLSIACSHFAAAQGPPADWIETLPPTTEEAWLCANWSRDAWDVESDASGTTVQIQRARTKSGEIVLTHRDGRFIGTNRGEWGGMIEWEPSESSIRTVLLQGNPVAFLTSPIGVFAAEGLGHGLLNRGRVVKFERSGEEWKVENVLDLGAAPQAVRLVGSTALLIATNVGVTEVNLEKMTAAPLFTNERWGFVLAKSIVRLSSGVIFVGAVRAVIKLSPASTGFVERWWVPSSCAQLEKSPGVATCQCSTR
jgi:hypothetical protein